MAQRFNFDKAAIDQNHERVNHEQYNVTSSDNSQYRYTLSRRLQSIDMFLQQLAYLALKKALKAKIEKR